MYRFPIGVIIDSFRVDIKTAVEKAAAVGANGIQVYSTRGEMAPENLVGQKRADFRKLVADNGLVISALCDAFFENRPLKFEDLEKNISTTVPLSMTQREQILALRAWANVRAVSATKTSNLKEYKKDIDDQNVASSRGGRTLDF